MYNLIKISVSVVTACILLITVNVNKAESQVYEEWVALYEGEAPCQVLDTEGNLYVSGTNLGIINTTIKYNPEGEILWECNHSVMPEESVIDAQGNIYVGGTAPNCDFAAIKISPNGDQIWLATYNGTGNNSDFAHDIAVDIEGNVYITGESDGNGSSKDYATVKFDSSGTEQWVSRYNGAGNGYDLACSVAVDDAGYVYVSGYSTGSSNPDYTTIKYDPDGNELWIACYNGPENEMDCAHDMTIDSDGNVYVTGSSSGGMHSLHDFATIKYSTDGEELWVARYDGPRHAGDGGHAIAVDDDRNVYVAGSTNGSFIFESECCVIKYDSTGAEEWVASYSLGSGSNWFNDLVLDDEGNVYATGASVVWIYADYTTIKYSNHGDELWVMNYNNPADYSDIAYSIAIDNNGNVYVTGLSGSEDHRVLATIKYRQESAGVAGVENYSVNKFGLNPPCPNPFNNRSVVSFSLERAGEVSLKVFDITGREVASLVNGHLSLGYHEVVWDASGMASGVYFVELISWEHVYLERLLLIK